MIKKVVIPGALAGIVMLLIGIALSRAYLVLLPSLNTEYANTGMFRPWSDPLMTLYFVQPFVVGLVLAWIWNKVKVLFPVNSAIGNGFRFGIVYWVFSFGGMLISYSSFPISLTMTAT